MSHDHASRHIRAYVVKDIPGRVVFRLEPDPSEDWVVLFQGRLPAARIRDAGAVTFDRGLLIVEKDPGSESTARAVSAHIVEDVVELVAETCATYREAHDFPMGRPPSTDAAGAPAARMSSLGV